MSESDGEQAARSVALEQVYVHEVYEQCAEKTAQSRHWPRIYQFLEELEPGALVCDVGCGNGKYLSVNQNVFKVGADRCKRLTDIAREKENEVLICDNLSLPFRDDSFDAVLSIAVVHHFATTERRVHALKELARVLRIGGRLVISVWAMEQRHRKFESQDVLVPWPKGYCLGSSLGAATSSAIPYADEMQHNQNASKDYVTSKRGSRKKFTGKSYWIDPTFSPSPSTSSLSSPNETCYSFVRRALQKLAGSKRGNPANRPWFLETWSHSSGKERRRIQHDDSGDVNDLPIELRRLEDINLTLNKMPEVLSVKSKSLGDILETQRLNLVRSRSSIPGLCSTVTSESFLNDTCDTPSSSSNSKPKLVKQKSHVVENTCLEITEQTVIRGLVPDLPGFQTAPRLPVKRGNVHKQSSMNEELMSIDRLIEKERVRRNIMKQASLNEEIMCKRKTFDVFKDSLCSGTATKRFQLLKSGLTSRIKQSSTNIEKVSGMSIKNGFVKILQGWSSAENETNDEGEEPRLASAPCEPVSPKLKPTDKLTTSVKKDADSVEQRLSREDGSDSSKDSSLQSDTSVDSEDSFASVIYVPKQDMSLIIDAMSMPPGYQLSPTSAPPSPRVKHPPDLTGSRLKLIPISPLLKQFPASSKSLPPTSPPGLSPRTLNSATPKPFFGAFSNHPQPSSIYDKFKYSKKTDTNPANQTPPVNPSSQLTSTTSSTIEEPTTDQGDAKENKTLPSNVGEEIEAMRKSLTSDKEASTMETTLTTVAEEPPTLYGKEVEKSKTETANEDESREAQLNQIKELLKQKPGFATRCAKPSFPLVRRASTAAPGRLEMVTKPLPRLLSLELFNPETDDLDSDSSGVSSPESVGSVVNVTSDGRFSSFKGIDKLEANDKGNSQNMNKKIAHLTTKDIEFDNLDNNSYELLASRSTSGSSTEISIASSQSLKLLEAAANVASSLENAAEKAIYSKPATDCLSRTQNFANDTGKFDYSSSWGNIASPSEIQELLDDSSLRIFPSEENTRNEECQSHLIDFTEKPGESLIQDIDEYCEKTKHELNADSPSDPFGPSLESKVEKRTNESNIPAYNNTEIDKVETCKYRELLKVANWSNRTIHDEENSEIDNKPTGTLLGSECSTADLNGETVINNLFMENGNSEDTMDFVMISNNGEFAVDDKNDTKIVFKEQRSNFVDSNRGMPAYRSEIADESRLQFSNSIESSDIGDSMENATTFSDCSQTESFRGSAMTEKMTNGSIASLESIDNEEKTKRSKSKIQSQVRSASEEITSRPPMIRQQASINSECLLPSTNDAALTGSSSQESLPSDHGGGAITYHQYYHVFREGELDQLINKYVENLHIISSYYDHASWCIVAEKVQVWTI